MEIKIEVSDKRFRAIMEKELEGFTKEELHEICRKALIQQLSDPNVFRGLFVEERNGYNYDRAYYANDILKEAVKDISFEDTYKELADGIISYIKEHHGQIIHEVVMNMFLEGLNSSITCSSEFRNQLSLELYHITNDWRKQNENG